MAHVSEAKKQELERITNLLKASKNIGILDLTSLPSAQFQKIKSKLKDKLSVTVTKKSIIKLALEQIKSEKKDIEKLEKDLENCMPALLITNEDAFKISKVLDQNKSNLAAKPGQVAPKDITIPEGPTSFTPGPIIGELGQVGIIATVENGKIVVKKESLIVKKGETLTEKQTNVLDKFGIELMEIGLNLKVMYQDGEIFRSDILSISEKDYLDNLQNSVREALNFAVFVAYPTKETTEILLQKAEREALFLSTKIPEDSLEIEEKKEQIEEELKIDEKEQHIPLKSNEEKVEKIAEKEAEKLMEREKTENSNEKTKTQDLKNPVEYSEEEAEKAQDILNKMKDKDIQK